MTVGKSTVVGERVAVCAFLGGYYTDCKASLFVLFSRSLSTDCIGLFEMRKNNKRINFQAHIPREDKSKAKN